MGTPLWKTEFNRSISVMENQVLKEFRIDYITTMGIYYKNKTIIED